MTGSEWPLHGWIGCSRSLGVVPAHLHRPLLLTHRHDSTLGSAALGGSEPPIHEWIGRSEQGSGLFQNLESLPSGESMRRRRLGLALEAVRALEAEQGLRS